MECSCIHSFIACIRNEDNDDNDDDDNDDDDGHVVRCKSRSQVSAEVIC